MSTVGHRELIGACRPRVVDREATLRSFGCAGNLGPAEDYLLWVRQVAEARWAADDVFRFPWWATARSEEEIADAHRHPSATTFDGRRLAEERAELEFDELVRRAVSSGGFCLAELASRQRGEARTRGRLEFTTLAVGRYGARVCDISRLLDKHPNSVTKWLNRGLRLERDDPRLQGPHRPARRGDLLAQLMRMEVWKCVRGSDRVRRFSNLRVRAPAR
jgi:hypothetical protein